MIFGISQTRTRTSCLWMLRFCATNHRYGPGRQATYYLRQQVAAHCSTTCRHVNIWTTRCPTLLAGVDGLVVPAGRTCCFRTSNQESSTVGTSQQPNYWIYGKCIYAAIMPLEGHGPRWKLKTGSRKGWGSLLVTWGSIPVYGHLEHWRWCVGRIPHPGSCRTSGLEIGTPPRSIATLSVKAQPSTYPHIL